jgi:cell division septal protein FtsQ
MVEERLAERRAEVRAARRRARLRRTLLVALLLVLLGVVAGFARSEHAQVRTLIVEGTVRLDADTVEEASGVVVGDSALLLWPPRVALALEELPLVRSAEVSRRRLRDVVLRVVERAPVYGVTYRGEPSLVDRDGIVVARGADPRLPTVRVRSAPPRAGESVAGHPALANAHRVWTGLSGPLRSRVVVMEAPDEDGLELVLDDGMVVRFGRAELVEEKIRALGAVLDDVAGTEVTLVDVRVPSFPVVRID